MAPPAHLQGLFPEELPMCLRRRVRSSVDGRLQVVGRFGWSGRVDRCAQPTEVVEVPGGLVGEVPNVVTEGRASPAPFGQLPPANPGQEAGI